MNVTELARKLRVTPEDLRGILPDAGFDVGRRAIKIDDRTAKKVMESWPQIAQLLEKKRAAAKEAAAAELKKLATERGPVQLPPVITVRDFATRLGLPVTRVIQEFMKNGILASLNERVDYDTASIVAEDLGFQVSPLAEGDQPAEVLSTGDIIKEAVGAEAKGSLVARPPVIVVMGHVDHGKTKLLDTIRSADVAAGEAGGITQHIGAYQTQKNGRLITFIDTPGHEAFTAMRSRGAKIADIAILVVAADDGVQPQTKEAIKIIEAAKLPFVVAINKVDKPEADPERVKRELSELNVLPEEWGGNIPMQPISAKTGLNIDKLLELILLVADVKADEIRANPNRRAQGTVIESHVNPGEGVVATLLVQNGTLKRNEELAIGSDSYGKVRAMKNYRGENVDSAPPGTPVRILGFRVAPQVGDVVEVPEAGKKLERVRELRATGEKIATVEKASQEEAEEKKLVPLIIKADVLGSLEAILVSFEKFSHPEVGLNVVSKGLGNITEADVLRAEATGAHVVGFSVLVPPPVAELAREKGVSVKTYKIIYDLFNDLTAQLEGMLTPEVVRTDFGRLLILKIFRTERDEQIVGGRVEDGRIVKGLSFEARRGGEPLAKGEVKTVQSGKQEVPELRMGSEGGMKVKTSAPLAEGDSMLFYKEEKKTRKIVFDKPK
ncbi:translation initiation factor IF-2 [Patescibacteria group bacterium]|nr:MAG: translation initiation factor IF-2 [Patescibacteria group bacterium]